MTVIIGPLLPERYSETIESIWDDLVDEFGIDRYVDPYPHFTLYGLERDTDVASIEDAVRAVVTDYATFSVHTDGLGIFPGYRGYRRHHSAPDRRGRARTRGVDRPVTTF